MSVERIIKMFINKTRNSGPRFENGNALPFVNLWGRGTEKGKGGKFKGRG